MRRSEKCLRMDWKKGMRKGRNEHEDAERGSNEIISSL